MKKCVTNNKLLLLLSLLILIQCIYLSVDFGVNKKGYHSDELWNYGFANSSTGTNIYSEDGSKALKNFYEWKDSQILYDYITVDESEIFDYTSLYHNTVNDFHPFLGFIPLHFVCSLFPGTFSMWYGFVVNLLFFVIGQIFLYKLTVSLTKSPEWGIITCFFYGFTTACEDIYFFLRIYAPAATFAIMMTYYMVEIYHRRKDFSIKKHYPQVIKLVLSCLCGCLTLHLFLLYAFITTFVFCAIFLFQKRIRMMFSFGFTMTLSVGASILIYPATINHLFLSEGTFGSHISKYDLLFQYKTYLSYLTNDLFGFATSPWHTMTAAYIGYGLLIFIFFLIPVCFLLRHEKKFHSFIRTLKNKSISFIKKYKNFPLELLPLFAGINFILIANAKMTSVLKMGRTANRYIMIVYPIAAVFASVILFYILTWIIKKKLVRTITAVFLAAFFAISSIILAEHIYYFNYPKEGVTLDSLGSDSNCIITIGDPWLLTCLTYNVGQTNQFFVTNYSYAKYIDYQIENIDLNEPLYLLMDTSVFDSSLSLGGINLGDVTIQNDYSTALDKDEYIEFYKNLNFVTNFELVGTDYSMFGRKIEIYRLN